MDGSRESDLLWIKGARWVLLLCLAGFVFVAKDLRHVTVSSGDNRLWLPKGTAESRVYKQFSRRFGAEDLLLVSWEGCKYDDPRLMELAAHLRKLDNDLAHYEGRPAYFKLVNTYGDVRQAISSTYVDKDVIDKKIRENLEGFLIGSDSETGVVLIEGSAYCANHREAVFSFVDRECRDFLKHSVDLKYSGPLYLSVCASRETRLTLYMVTPLVAVISLLVALILLRNFVLAMLSFVVSGMAAIFSIAAIHYGGKDLGDMLSVVPSLAQLLAMSNAIHFINYYSED
ncbi:MAG: hypothetical protein P1V20_27680, partial [Verrucomicrobiales bacterium]|nr:hypothetical protein [Verrucomicrobiales bacterium]